MPEKKKSIGIVQQLLVAFHESLEDLGIEAAGSTLESLAVLGLLPFPPYTLMLW